MAVIRDNIFVLGARGRVGNLIYRIRYGILEIYSMSKGKKKKPSPAQKAQRFLMKRAVAFAKGLKTNETMRLFYEEIARKRHFTNAYHAAISHVLTNPKILEVDFSEYLAEAGDSIRFKPKVWNKVEKIKVTLKDVQGETIESGWAQEDAKGWWKYRVQVSHANTPAVTVVFEIHDDVFHMKIVEMAVPA